MHRIPDDSWRSAAAPLVMGLLLAEAMLFTYARNLAGPYASPVILLVCSVAACLLVLRVARNQPWPVPAPGRRLRPVHWVLAGLAVLEGVLFCWPQYRHVVRSIVAQDKSDIIMALTVYPQRLLAGQTVYVPLTQELGYFALPTYLPATWFPFVVPEVLGFDYRWMSGLIFVLGLGAYLWLLLRQQLSAGATFALALLPFVLTYAVVATEEGLVGWTVELMIVGYYLALVASILGRVYWAQVLLLTLCLLSRFSLVFWVPLHLGLLFLQDSRPRAVRMAIAIVLGVLLLYVVPFLSHDWGMFMRVQRAYTEVALGEWNSYLTSDGLPYHLTNGVGMGLYYYMYWPGEMLERLQALQRTHVLLLLTIVLGAAVAYWRQRGARTDYRVYSVVILKLYLAVFYAFLQVPYVYLAVVGLFLSLYLVLLTVRYTSPAVPAAD